MYKKHFLDLSKYLFIFTKIINFEMANAYNLAVKLKGGLHMLTSYIIKT